MKRHAALALVLAAGLLVAVVSVCATGPDRPTVPTLLSWYDSGEYEAVTRALAAWSDVNRLREQLTGIAPGWIRSGAASAASRRRLVAASVGLEAARAHLAEWNDSRHLVEWGCELLRGGGPPLAAERHWQLAAAGLIESAGDTVFLVGLPFMVRDPHPSRGTAIGHLPHAEARFPNETRFRLLRATALERASWQGDSRGPIAADETMVAGLAMGGDRDGSRKPAIPAEWRFDRVTAGKLAASSHPPPGAALRSLALWQVIDLLTPLLSDPTVGPEARLRLGVTWLRLGRRERGTTELAASARASTDPFIVYLSHYFMARALEAGGDRRGAELEFRAALEAVPRAQSSALSLAALLFTSGNREEAIELAGLATREPLPPDPWRQYFESQARFVPRWIDQLRGALR